MIVLPIRVESREPNPRRSAESYILQNTAKNAYIASCSETRSPDYQRYIMTLKMLIENGAIKTKSEARVWMAYNTSKAIDLD